MTLMVAGRQIPFLIDTGATFSVLREFWGPTSPAKSSIVRVEGKPYNPLQSPPISCHIGQIGFTHSFLIIPSCPIPLLGRDILTKLGASISFSPTMHLSQDSSAIPLLMTLQKYTAQTESSYPLPPSLVDPKFWDTHEPSVAECCTHSSKGPNILLSPGPISPSLKEPYRTSTNHPGFKAERLPVPCQLTL